MVRACAQYSSRFGRGEVEAAAGIAEGCEGTDVVGQLGEHRVGVLVLESHPHQAALVAAINNEPIGVSSMR